MAQLKVELWILFATSVLLVSFSVYLFWQCHRIHEATVSQRTPMSTRGHLCVILHAYALPMVVGVTQLLAWVGYAEDWDQRSILLALMVPCVPACSMYCMLNRSLHRLQQDQTANEVYHVGDVLRYNTLGGIQKDVHVEQHHEKTKIDAVLAPPVCGLKVVEVMPGGNLRLHHPRQLYRSDSPNGNCHIAGPFLSVAHRSVLARDHEHAAEEGQNTAKSPLGALGEDGATLGACRGIRTIDIAARHPNDDVRTPPPPPPPPLGVLGGSDATGELLGSIRPGFRAFSP